jgi:hypothetical protein
MVTKVLTQEELQELKNTQNKRAELIERFGIIELTIQDLELQKDDLIKELSDLKQQEIEIGGKLQSKYGKGTINIERGEFTGID